jgi:predicted CopG family antitoxin
MSDTSIRVSEDLADELYDRKDRGESYEDVIWRLIEQAEERDSDTPD